LAKAGLGVDFFRWREERGVRTGERGQRREGSPIKGPVKRKNTSPWQKKSLFSLGSYQQYQHGLVFTPARTRYFS
jgi:hypothetical protein